MTNAPESRKRSGWRAHPFMALHCSLAGVVGSGFIRDTVRGRSSDSFHCIAYHVFSLKQELCLQEALICIPQFNDQHGSSVHKVSDEGAFIGDIRRAAASYDVAR